MKIKQLLSGTMASALLSFGILGGSMVSAETIDLGTSAPNTGSVTLNSNDQIIAASSNYYGLKVNSEKLEIQNRSGSEHFLPTGSWTYFSDHHNFLNGYKWGHSNFLSKKRRHGSYAHLARKNVGGGWVYASAGHWSYSTAKGYGTFTAKYDGGL